MANFLKSLFVKGVEIDTDGADNGEVLTYNGTKFAPATATASVATLDAIGDVTAPSPASGDFLKWNGSAWVNDPINLGTDTVGSYVSTVNGASGAISNVAVTTGKLDQFASTTSSELAGVISDETGSGLLVFNTSPLFTTPRLASTSYIADFWGEPVISVIAVTGSFTAKPHHIRVTNTTSAGTPSIQGISSTDSLADVSLNLRSQNNGIVQINGVEAVTISGSQALTSKTYNGLTITTTTGTLTITNGKTASISNTLTFTGTDGSSVAFGTGGTVAYTASPTLTNVTINSSASGQPLTIGAVDGTNEGGDIKLNGAGAYGTVNIDNYQGTLRGIVGSTARWVATSTGVDVTGTFTASGSSTLNALLTVNDKIFRSGNVSSASWTTAGSAFQNAGATFTDTTGSGTIANRVASSFGTPTFASSSSVTITDASTVYITAAPSAGTNTTITNAYAIKVAAGNSLFNGDITADTFTVPSGSFFRTVAFPTTSNTATVRVGSALGYEYCAKVSSFRDLKENIVDIPNALSTISTLRPRRFTWKPQPFDTPEAAELRQLDTTFGFIVEEVAETNYELLCWSQPEEQYGIGPQSIEDLNAWTPSYWRESDMIALCVAAIKELTAKVAELEAKVG